MEIASLLISFLSLIVAIIALVKSDRAQRRANDISQNSLNVDYATVELEMRRDVTQASERISTLSAELDPLITKSQKGELSAEEGDKISTLQASWTVAVQNYLNVYDVICGSYLDSKIDRGRFRKNFAVEIRNLVEKEVMKKFLDPTTSSYKAILKVYKEWEDLEK